MIIRSHEIGSLVTSYDHPYVYMYRKMMIIRSHEVGSLVTSYDHHFPILHIYIRDKDDHNKSPNSQLHGFLGSSFSYMYIHKDDHKKS